MRTRRCIESHVDSYVNMRAKSAHAPGARGRTRGVGAELGDGAWARTDLLGSVPTARGLPSITRSPTRITTADTSQPLLEVLPNKPYRNIKSYI